MHSKDIRSLVRFSSTLYLFTLLELFIMLPKVRPYFVVLVPFEITVLSTKMNTSLTRREVSTLEIIVQ